MSYKHTAERLADYRRQIRELRQKMRDVQAAVEPEPVKDYTFRRAGGGSVRLSELFGDKADLFVIHNILPELSLLHVVGGRVQRRLCAPEQPCRVRRLLARYTRQAAEVRGKPALDISHGVTRGHHVRRRHGLPSGRRLDAGSLRVPAPEWGDRAGVRRAVFARRRFLQRLALLRSHSRRRRRLAAELQVRVRPRHPVSAHSKMVGSCTERQWADANPRRSVGQP